MASLIVTSVILSLSLALVLVPFVRFTARKIGMVDRPDAERKLHQKPVALGGGIAVFVAATASFALTVIIDRWNGTATLGYMQPQWHILYFAAACMLAVGLIDDVFSLRGRQKLLMQCLIIAVIVGSGTIIDSIGLLGFEIELGVFAFPITVLWLLIAVNALNLIDGADGMATTAAIIICVGLGVLSLAGGAALNAVVAFGLAGALLGFLCFNRPPATIYLGDAGSMTIGLLIGVFAIWSSVKESTVLASAPVAILAIPLFDSSAAIVRRWLTGRSLYATDRGHLHHLLQEKFGPYGMLLVVAVLCSSTTILAVLSVTFDLPWLAAAGVAVVLGVLVYTRSFGHAEYRLVLGRGMNFAKSFATRSHSADNAKLHTRIPIQGSGNWDAVWDQLVEFAENHELAKIRIDLNIAWLQEGYHATWKSVRQPEKAFKLVVKLPLFTRRQSDGEQASIGILEIVAPAIDNTVYERIADVSNKLVELVPQIDAIIVDLEANQSAKRKAVAAQQDGLSPVDKTAPTDSIPVSHS
ncbi:MraY family glycosyltransferase [Stieleria marina]|uniref:WecA-like glycosyltransferase n=1 Tax=Stieleria marina TaxID=1930275 RepID=A0A517P165_9BACT|nr:WecA-like glycosyltransferase [Planctomycetes bacterium K23_9]